MGREGRIFWCAKSEQAMTSAQTLAREKIRKARDATAGIDLGLWDAITALQRIGQVSNGAAIYADVPGFRAALGHAASAIVRAQEIVRATDWPTDEDYDIA
jgi:hypothetical protein